MKIQTTLFLVLFSTLLIAQDVLLFEDTKTETLVFSTHNTGETTPYLKQILQSLKAPSGHSASFDLAYEYNCRLVEKPNKLFTDLHFNHLNINHAPRLKGFSFGDLLLPSSATITIDLLAADEVVHSVCKTINLSNLNQAYIHFDYSDIQPATVYTLFVKELVFNYSSGALQAVNRRKSDIDKYFLAADDLQKIRSNLSELDGVRPDPDHLNTLSNDVEQWVVQFNKIQNASFWNTLALEGNGGNDPKEIRKLNNDTKKELDNVQGWLQGLTANIHELFYEKGVALFESQQISAAKSAFEKSISSVKDYAPSHYFLAHIDFNDGHVSEAGKRIIRVLNDYNPDSATRRSSEELARHIIGFHFDLGQREVDAGNFPEGVAIYRDAQAFGQQIRGFHYGQQEAESRIREAYYLDLHQQLDQVVFLQRQGNHRQALINMEQALAFQVDFNIDSSFDTYSLHKDIVLAIFEQHLDGVRSLVRNQAWDEGIVHLKDTESFLTSYRHLIQNDKEWLNLRNQILVGKHQSLYDLAALSKTSGKLDKALNEATDALDFATSNGLSNSYVTDSQQQIKGIQESRYQRFIFGGDKARQQQQFNTALNQYEAARSLENTLSYIPSSTSLNQKLKGTALQEIKLQYNTTMQQFSKDNNRIAASFNSIQELSGRYHLTLEPEVKAIYEQLEGQQCNNARQILLPELEQELAHFQQIADYAKALESIDDIKALLAQYPQCGLSDKVIIDQAATVAVCASYQQALQAALATEQNRRFRNALDHYLQAKELYRNPLVSSHLDGHPAFNTYEYVLHHPDDQMVLAGANLYLDQREHDASLALLKSLIAKGIPVKRTEGLQERLGSALAVRHYVASTNWKISLSNFVAKHERKNYKSLQRAFRKQWNRMG